MASFFRLKQISRELSSSSFVSSMAVRHIEQENRQVYEELKQKTNEYIAKMNDDLLNVFYDNNNQLLSNYSFKLDKKKQRYIETNKPDKKLFIKKNEFLGKWVH